MRVLGAFTLILMAGALSPARAADGPPESGTAKLSAYQVCHPLASIDMSAAGAASATECNGIVRSADKTFDNLAIHCLETTNAQPQNYQYSGTCVQTDGDGDKIFMTYRGAKSGQVQWIGGAGKFADVTGEGSLGVVAAPGGSDKQFAYTLTYDVNWSRKPR